ncbi:MAG TPA: prephenate dehydratase [Candidatus Omnitrophica bacterium]|nr:prephenate dehydratase [Candidatus Omnitrophota bacterium]
MDIQRLRKEIDKIDKEILRLLNKRAEVAVQIGKIKKEKGFSLYCPLREKNLINTLIKKNEGPLPPESIENIYREILSASVNLQKGLTIAYLGPEATFTNEAARKKFGSAANYHSLSSIKEIFTEVEKARADFGVVPVENSTEGVETHTLDMFIESDLKICDEILLPISHYFLSKSKKDEIRMVYSHPQALAQCRIWLQKNLPNVQLKEVYSTAQAARLAAKEKGTAAIASELASKLYNLSVIGQNIEDSSRNVTRFLVIGKEWSKPTGKDKTSLMFSVRDKVGALYSSLKPFYDHKINLTKIESRPSKRRLWEYYFFVDFEGHCEEERVKKALGELKTHCTFLKILGSYSKG